MFQFPSVPHVMADKSKFIANNQFYLIKLINKLKKLIKWSQNFKIDLKHFPRFLKIFKLFI